MRKTTLGKYLPAAFTLLLVLASVFVAQQSRRTQSTPAQASNLKISYRTTTSGQTTESTTMIRGQRERSEMRLGYGMEIVNITQCDLKRTIQVSDKTRKYVITPMDTGDEPDSASPRQTSTSTPTPTTRGGVITYVTTATDTGERREMFGFQARHIKTSISIESSPDACSPIKQRMETDGWYIDFSYGLNCEVGRPQAMTAPSPSGGCRDRMQFKRIGTARTGLPLQETTTMYGPDGKVVFTSTKEVVELSRAPLDAALFDVPAGYAETSNAQELYAMPSVSEMMSQAGQSTSSSNDRPSNPSNPVTDNTPGRLRVGVVQINNRTSNSISTDALRGQLIAEIEGANIDAIPLNAISVTEANSECASQRCDFILYTDLTTLKTSKLGGMFGRVTGVSGAGKTETKIEYKLFAVGETSPRLQSAASAKEEGVEASAQAAILSEARAVLAEIQRRGRK